ncbi:hypothetical protein [Vagococcus bubulae]|uniref:Uncharacterized protein n=1 Tax=Vagococcus bubulae TaxID=1977868 RepID=A0A429ZRF5_9ENTE|nr:hypothetical protein [Vagococcus bubulae]RST96267.1 hypothetical protein CBF36_00620 [Vagococcus bubulae]
MWSGYIIPFLTILFSYFLGLFSNKATKKDVVDLKRYETFYVPFMSKTMHLSYSKQKHSKLPLHIRREFTNLIMENIQYLGKDSSKIIPEYYYLSAEIITLELDKRLPDIESDLERVYQNLEIAILQEAESLSKSLKYPNLARVILNDIESKIKN